MVRHERLHRLAIETAVPTRSEEEEIQLPHIRVDTRSAPVAEERGRDNNSRSGCVQSHSTPDVVNLIVFL